MPSQSKTVQSYVQDVQPGAWWAIQKTSGPGEEQDELISPFIDSIPASQFPVVRRVTPSTETGKSQTPHWHFAVQSKVAFNVPFFFLLLFLVDLHICLSMGLNLCALKPLKHLKKILKPHKIVAN